MSEGAKKSVQLIEMICNASAMTNKWIMWADRAFSEQASYAISIYQLRDAFSHIMSMFTYGFTKEFLHADDSAQIDDWEGFYNSTETYNQLRDTFGHVARAFFDCADYIHMMLSSVTLTDDESNVFLSRFLERYSKDVDNLRIAKSEQEGVT